MSPSQTNKIRGYRRHLLCRLMKLRVVYACVVYVLWLRAHARVRIYSTSKPPPKTLGYRMVTDHPKC